MKKLLTALILSPTLILSSLATAAEPTNYHENITAMRADYLDDSKETKYYYKFSNNVCKSAWIESGDANVNRILRIAYVLNQKVDIGVNLCDVVTTVRVKN